MKRRRRHGMLHPLVLQQRSELMEATKKQKEARVSEYQANGTVRLLSRFYFDESCRVLHRDERPAALLRELSQKRRGPQPASELPHVARPLPSRCAHVVNQRRLCLK